MKLYPIDTGNFKLDGGAMFGVVPKSMWNKVYPADDNNMCNLALRCLLIETENKLVLIDAGLGNKQSEKFFSYYYLNGKGNLDNSLKSVGYHKKDVTDVILTHLHFDHCGGAIEKDEGNTYKPTFTNANYWISEPQWRWAMEPNQREMASYFPENFEPLEKTGKLHFINQEGNFNKEIELRFYNGHTEGLMVPFIHFNNHTIIYTSDLIPTAAHIPHSWVCGFDTRPLISMKERNNFLKEACDGGYFLFFEHDIFTECCSLEETEKGIRVKEKYTLEELVRNQLI
jgi:glyoxylase-like metal-dependent hydrolase (beta-lactamase superfamily II)